VRSWKKNRQASSEKVIKRFRQVILEKKRWEGVENKELPTKPQNRGDGFPS